MPDLLDRLKAALADRYRVDREIGWGGMARVFLAHDLKLDRPVALKVLRPDLAAVIGRERFRREIQVAASLDHPYILGIHADGEADGILYYEMPYLPGESLRDRLHREKQLPLEEALQIAREVAEALSYAHSRGIIHRDIKPENILVRAGHVAVADFGIARAIDEAGGERLTATGIALGTPPYMSPEQVTGRRDLDGRSDIYSLGCMLYEMLAGDPPFTGPPESVVGQHLTAEPPAIAPRRSSVPPHVVAALGRALAKTPADRFSTAAQFAEALGPRAAVLEAPVQVLTSKPKNTRRRWLGLGVGVVVLAVGGGLTWRVVASNGAVLQPAAPRPFTIVAAATGSAEPDLRGAVQALVTLGLEQAGALAPLPDDQVRRGLELAGKQETLALSVPIAQELAVRGGIRTVVAPTLDRVGRQFLLGLRVLDVDSAVVLAVAESRAAGEDDLMDAADRALRALLKGLALQSGSIGASRPLRQVATPSFQALKKYLLAEEVWRSGALGGQQAAATLLRDALALDTAFAAAWVSLGAAYFNMGQRDSASWAFERALGFPSRLNETGRYHAEAVLKYSREGDDYEPALARLAIYEKIILLDPNDARAYSYRAGVLEYLRRFEEAVESGTRAFELSPFPSAQGLREGMMLLVSAGRLQEARGVLDRLQEPVRWRQYNELALALAARDWVRAESLATRYLQEPSSAGWVPGRSAFTLASVYAARGAVGRADSVLRTALPAHPWGYAMSRLMLGLATGLAVPAELAAVPDTGLAEQMWELARATVTGDSGRVVVVLRAIQSLEGTARHPAFAWRLASQVRLAEAIVAAGDRRWTNVVALARAEMKRPLGAEVDVPFRWLSGVAHESLGNLDSAAHYFDMVTQSTGFEAEYEIWRYGIPYSFAHFRLGRIYAQLGRVSQARDHYATFLETFSRPDPEYAWMVTEAHAKLAELTPRR